MLESSISDRPAYCSKRELDAWSVRPLLISPMLRKYKPESIFVRLNARHVLRDRLSITSTYLDSSFRTTLQFQNPDVEAASPIGIGSDRLPFSNGQY